VAFSAIAATEEGVLDTKTELIALAISVAIRCDGCVALLASSCEARRNP
jgi:alkylhydroperoxidase/carboxymuconolactone decarboxylase family protein YurZ